MMIECKVLLPAGYERHDVVDLELKLIKVIEEHFPDAPIIFELRSEEYERKKPAEPDLFDVKPKE